jgi:two-component system sensor histidine kinase KdpD
MQWTETRVPVVRTAPAQDDGPAGATALALVDALAGDGTVRARLQRGLDALAVHWSCACGVALAEPIRRELGLPAEAVAGGPPAPSPGRRASAALRAGDDDLGRLWAGGSAASARLPETADRLARWLAGERRADRQRREVLELRRGDALKTALLRGVSHEFRSPLTAIANAGAALGVVDEPSERRALLDGLLEECGRLERLVDNLLDLSRLEGGVLSARLDWCAPEELIGGAVRAAGVLLADARVETRLEPAVSLVRADPVMTERILVNLLHNAVRHGRPPVLITSAPEGRDLAITVQDAGPGVDPAVLPRVFEPFVHREDEGLGLGLPLCQRLAAAQGARLEHRPTAGGACFALLLPLSEPPVVGA